MNEERIKKLKRSAERYTAYRERSPKEVADKLAEWDARPEEIAHILTLLIEEKFVDEERFARAFCHDKFLINKWGKRRISLELGRHRLSKQAIDQGLAYINPEEYWQVLKHLAESKWNRLKDPDETKKKQKTAAFLMQKGYEPDLVWDAIHEVVQSPK